MTKLKFITAAVTVVMVAGCSLGKEEGHDYQREPAPGSLEADMIDESITGEESFFFSWLKKRAKRKEVEKVLAKNPEPWIDPSWFDQLVVFAAKILDVPYKKGELEYLEGVRLAPPIPKDGKSMMGGMINDDPLIIPNYDVGFNIGVDGGIDIFMTVDTSREKPGAGTVDGHSGDSTDLIDDGPEGDLYILGDYRTPYYAGKDERDDADNDLVYIDHLDTQAGKIRLHGSPGDYELIQTKSPRGTAIVWSDTFDVIGWIRKAEVSDLSLSNPVQFEYDFAPTPVPAASGLEQPDCPGSCAQPISATDSAGNVYFLFQIAGEVAGFPGDGSFGLAKYSPDGTRLWARRHGSVVPDDGHGEFTFALTVNDQFVFVAGGTEGNYGGIKSPGGFAALGAFVAKFDGQTGDELIVRQYFEPEYHTVTFHMTKDNSGHLYAGGGHSTIDMSFLKIAEYYVTQFIATYLFDIDNIPCFQPWLAKIRMSDLEMVWIDKIHTIDPHPVPFGFEGLSGIIFVPDDSGIPGKGTIVHTGYAAQTITGGLHAEDKDGYVYEDGVSPWSTWMAKHDDQGNLLWAKPYIDRTMPTDEIVGGGVYQPVNTWGTAVDSDGNIYTGGTTFYGFDGQPYTGNGDAFVRKHDPDGNQIWTRVFGTTESDNIRSLIIIDDVLYAVGDTRGDLAGPNRGMVDQWIARIDTNGNTQAAMQYGTEKIEMGFNYNTSWSGNRIYLSSMTEGSMVGPHSGGWDVYLLAVDKDSLQILP